MIIVGPFCNNGGSNLFAAMYQSMALTTEPIEVDFTGTTGVTADFLASSFGALLDHHSRQAIEVRVKLINLDPAALELLRVIMDHADQYNNNAIYRKIIDVIQQRQATPPPDETPIHTGPGNKPPKSPHTQVQTKAIEV